MDELKETLQKIDSKAEIATQYYHFNDAATVNEILTVEGESGFILPKSYRIFLNHFDGGFISTFSVPVKLSFDSARWNSNLLLGIKEIQAEYEKLSSWRWKISSKNYEPYPFIPFCRTSENELLIFINSLSDNDESPGFDAFNEDWPANWGCLYYSFTQLWYNFIIRNRSLSTFSYKLLKVGEYPIQYSTKFDGKLAQLQ